MKKTLAQDFILIRPYKMEDAQELYEAVQASSQEISRFLPFWHPDYDISETQAWVTHCVNSWEGDLGYPFLITDRESGAIIGSVGLSEISCKYRMANLGYWVHSNWTGRGAASTAAKLAAKFAFEELDLVRIEIVVHPDNIASQKAALKTGALKEGLARNRIVNNDQVFDGVLFSLIPSDLK